MCVMTLGRLFFSRFEFDLSSKNENRPVVMRRCRSDGGGCSSNEKTVKRRSNRPGVERRGGGVLLRSRRLSSADSSVREMGGDEGEPVADLRRDLGEYERSRLAGGESDESCSAPVELFITAIFV